MWRGDESGIPCVSMDRRGAVRLISAIALGFGAGVSAIAVSAAGTGEEPPASDDCSGGGEPGEPGDDPAPASGDSYGGDSYEAGGEDGDVPPADGGDEIPDECDDSTMPISAPPPDFGGTRDSGKHRRKNRRRKNRRRNRR